MILKKTRLELMLLNDGHIRPGRVLEVCDEFGTIKACCSGLFSDQDKPDLLPPVYPLPIGCQNHFSKPNKDDEIWVIFFPSNPQELFYLRKDNFQENLSEIIDKDYKNIEVVASLDSGAGYAQLFFSDGTGWILRNDRAMICIDKSGNILLDQGSDHHKIHITDDGISLGSENQSAEPAVLGNQLAKCLDNISFLLKMIQTAASSIPYTIPISNAISSQIDGIDKSIERILSKHVTLD